MVKTDSKDSDRTMASYSLGVKSNIMQIRYVELTSVRGGGGLRW